MVGRFWDKGSEKRVVYDVTEMLLLRISKNKIPAAYMQTTRNTKISLSRRPHQ